MKWLLLCCLVSPFISLDVLVSRYPFDVDGAGGRSLVDSVDCVEDLLDHILSRLALG